jgi:hypothetical protein
MKLTEEQRKLVEQNVGLINVHIRRFVAVPRSPTRQREYDDLYQEGCLALMQAAKTHDPDRHGAFAAYAIPRIHHAISIALYERFSTVRVPAKSVKRARERRRKLVGTERHRPEPALVETHSLPAASLDACASAQQRHRPSYTTRHTGRPWRGDQPSIRSRLRHKYEAAVREAAERICAAGRGRSDRSKLIQRFVEERLLIPEPESRTAKRQLARDFNCSIGRIQTCEDALASETRLLLNADDEFQALLRLARKHEEGMDLAVDEGERSRLERAAADGFARRFARLRTDLQATVLRDLVCETMGSLGDFARRLFSQLEVRRRAHFVGAVMTNAPREGNSDDGEDDPSP